ncbi:MAG: hypothetical protein WC488_03295 [Candidatus Micrarchaeia archaeon]
MRMRKMPRPEVLIAGALEDGNRVLFMTRRLGERYVLELPCVIAPQGSNPVQKLSELFASSLGIDAQIHGIIREGRHNAGSRRSKRWIPVLVFKITAKKAFAKPSEGLGFEWLAIKDAKKQKLSRNCEWLGGWDA